MSTNSHSILFFVILVAETGSHEISMHNYVEAAASINVFYKNMRIGS